MGRGKPKNKKSLKHQIAKQIDGDLILIVCEGSETEPNYFKGICEKWKISNVTVVGEECGSAPISIVDHALQLKKDRDVKYDQIWCVFDAEGESLERAKDKALANKFNVAISVPSFEFWYLLHYTGSTGQLAKSADAERKLKTLLPNYKKNTPPEGLLLKKLNTAITNAEKVRNHHITGGTKFPANPSTDVDKLIKAIQKLERPKNPS